MKATSVLWVITFVLVFFVAPTASGAPRQHIPDSSARNTVILPQRRDLENVGVEAGTSNNTRSPWS